MEDIVERLDKFPIAEWQEAKSEILRLRELLSEGLPPGGVKYIPQESTLDSDSARTRIAELEEMVASLSASVEDKEANIILLKQQANPTALVTARAEIDALEKKLQMVLSLSNSAVEKKEELENELVKVNRLLTDTNNDMLTVRNLNAELSSKVSTLEHNLAQKEEVLNATLADNERLKGLVISFETKSKPEQKNKVWGFFNNMLG